jgi:hypothetical protein
MGKAFLCKSNGGGGGGLAFRVIGGTSAPSNPKPNDIWVNTNTEITSYIFSATEPEGYAPGMVWISTGTSSTAAFNALKKNGIQVYPLSAKQYIGGAWVNVAEKIFQNAQWVDFLPPKVLYSEGKEYIAFNLLDADPTKSGGGFAKEEDCLYIYAKNSAELVGGTAISAEKIDFKNINTVYFTVKAQGGNNDLKIVGLTTSSTGANFDQYTAWKFVNSTGEIAVDVSKVNTAQYICMAVASAGQNTYMRISKIRYE